MLPVEHQAMTAHCDDLKHQIMASSAPTENKSAAVGWLAIAVQLLTAAPQLIAEITPLIAEIEALLSGKTPTPAPPAT